MKHGFILLEITKNGERREIPIDNTLTMMFNSMLRGLESVYVFTDPRTGEPYKSVQTSFETAREQKSVISVFMILDIRLRPIW